MMLRHWIAAISIALVLPACGTAKKQTRLEPVTPVPSISPAKTKAPVERVRPEPPQRQVPEKSAASDANRAPAPLDPEDTADIRQGDSDAGAADSIYFSSGSTEIDRAGSMALRRHAIRLKRDSDLVVTLIGYADATGSRSYNLALAEKRMDSVSEALRSLGVARGQIRRVSAGRRTVGPACESSVCRQRMRRVELVYGE